MPEVGTSFVALFAFTGKYGAGTDSQVRNGPKGWRDRCAHMQQVEVFSAVGKLINAIPRIEARELVKDGRATWLPGSPRVQMVDPTRRARQIDTRIAAYAAHSYRVATARMVNIPIEWLTADNAAGLTERGQAVWLGDKAIAITDRKHVLFINWVRFRKMERQKHNRPPAPQLAERLVVERQKGAKARIDGRQWKPITNVVVKGEEWGRIVPSAYYALNEELRTVGRHMKNSTESAWKPSPYQKRSRRL
jgi:hypothetical protein